MLFERRPAARFAEDDGQFVPLADPVFLDDTLLNVRGVIAVLAAAADSPVVWDHTAAGSLLLLQQQGDAALAEVERIRQPRAGSGPEAGQEGRP